MKGNYYLNTGDERFSWMHEGLKAKLPFGFYYNVDSRIIVPREIEISTGDYSFSINISIWENKKAFLKLLKSRSINEYSTEFEFQLFYYNQMLKEAPLEIYNKEITKWYYYTEKLIRNANSYDVDLDVKYVLYAFEKWGTENNVNERIEIKEESNTISSEKEVDSMFNRSGNDFTLSTIEDNLEPFLNKIGPESYNILTKSLKTYFEIGRFPKINAEIKVGKVGLKRFGKALYEIYKSLKSEKLSYEYLEFAKHHISIFKTVQLNREKMTTCNLYKYFTS